MVINPGIEVYLIDKDGKILAFNAPEEKVKRNRISMDPVLAFLEGDLAFPLYGDDPRDVTRKKVFSVSPIYEAGRMEGYLYVVLGGEEFESVAALVGGSYIMRLGFFLSVVCLGVVLLLGLIAFGLLTGRLRALAKGVEDFRRGGFRAPLRLANWRRADVGDEIDRLGSTFEEMSQTIVDQFEALRTQDVERREMVANISHDLRTPLTSLIGALETLEMKGADLTDEERKQRLAMALRHGQRLQRLVRELFELASLEDQQSLRNPEPVSFSELVQDVAQKFQFAAREKDIELEARITEQTLFVEGDIALLERLLENLIENAIKYTPEGGRVTVLLDKASDLLQARVIDTGPGIPEEDLLRIFERFYRVEKNRGDRTAGSGLGLAIARRIVDLHGGYISAANKPDRGTIFSFELPLRRSLGEA
jgi:signal transduction histidine kinase